MWRFMPPACGTFASGGIVFKSRGAAAPEEVESAKEPDGEEPTGAMSYRYRTLDVIPLFRHYDR